MFVNVPLKSLLTITLTGFTQSHPPPGELLARKEGGAFRF